MASILIVEDSATQALRLRHTLEEAGFSVDCAASAEAALVALNERLPDLLVTDYRMPGMLGDELCRKIRMNVNTRGLPILMLTGEREGEIERHVLESGADDYVAKSTDGELILLRIQALLRKSNAQQVLFGGGTAFEAAKLLVVEDSATYREWLVGVLAHDGYAIETAATGAQALERLSLESFDGVILDAVLPDLGAAEICRSVTESRRTLDQTYVVLVLTASATRELATSVLAAGADDIVEKSRDIALIRTRLRALLRRKRLHEENARIASEFRRRELELARAHAQREAAEARAALADQLERANRELKEAQAQLVQAAKMSSLGQLVAGVAHEINNPLAFVMSHHATVDDALAQVARDVEPALTEAGRRKWGKARQRLRDMREGLVRIEDLVLKLRTFSRLDEGERKHVKIHESIDSVLALLQHKMKGRITLTRRYGDVQILACYPGPLNQVVMNLVANAIDAIDGEGEIVVSTGKRADRFFISVADTGKGISAEEQARIFEPFFTTKPVGQGTGLGLSISYGIIRRHGGSIEVRSEKGKGTEMTVLVPLEESAGGAAGESASKGRS